jgi:serine/threonine protein kinase
VWVSDLIVIVNEVEWLQRVRAGTGRPAPQAGPTGGYQILAAEYDGAEIAFAAEARLLAAMDHPHVVRVHGYVQADDLHLIVMKLLGGGV